jgi:glycosyltransferase involved in cell wall biosynthesis
MRFVLISTHIDQTTGYSKVSYNLIKQLASLSPKVKTYHFGFQRHPARAGVRKYPYGVSSYDAAANEDPKEEGFGYNKVLEYLEMVNPDVVMIYNDPYTICQFIQAMKYDPGKTPYSLWTYIDQVYDGIAEPVLDILRKNSDRVYCFSEVWKRKFLEYGPASDVRVLEHAVDPLVFNSIPTATRLAIRSNLNIPTDATILLNANRNSQRKRLDLTLQGFVRALRKNPSLYLILVTNVNPQMGAYYDIHRIFMEELRSNGFDTNVYIQRHLVLIDTSQQRVLDDEGINQLYNVSDIGINTSDGEGFGLCQLEHMYTGAPQIVTDVGTFRTFLNTAIAEFIPSNGRSYFPGGMPHGLWAATFSPDAVCHAIESTVSKLDEKRTALQSYVFKSWATVCDEFLEDVLTSAGGQATTVSVPVTS